LTSLSAIKYRIFSFSVKYVSSVAFPIAIARAYGPTVNGDVQLLIAATGYLGLLDSGMTISALNRAGMHVDDAKDNARSILQLQTRSSVKMFSIGIFIAGGLILAAGWNHWIGTSLLFGGALLALTAILEIAVTPFKYHLYSYGLAASAEKRETFLSIISTLALLLWSILILIGQIPLLFGLPIGLILLRADRVASGMASLRDLQSLAVLSSNNNSFRNGKKPQYPSQRNQNGERRNRLWISALQVLAVLNWSADIFLIKFIVGSSAVSDYSIYSKLFLFPVAIAALANPVIQSAVSQGRLNSARFALFTRASWLCILGATTLIVLVCQNIVFSFPLLTSRIGISSNPSVNLIITFSYLSMLTTVSGFYAPIANGLQIFRYQVGISAIFLPSNIFLSWLLGSRCGLGMVGILAATCFTMTITSCIVMPNQILKSLKNGRIQAAMTGIL